MRAERRRTRRGVGMATSVQSVPEPGSGARRPGHPDLADDASCVFAHSTIRSGLVIALETRATS